MRFVAFEQDTHRGLAIEHAGEIRGVVANQSAYPGDILGLLQAGPAALTAAWRVLSDAPALDPAKIAFLPPIGKPNKIICVGLNYADHARESSFAAPTYPTLFCRFTTSLIGHGAPMIRPIASDQLDFEGELVAIIGKSGRHIAREAALDHVAGYSVFNDGSIRDYQFKAPQWTVGKNFDGTGAFGPAFVTADELPAGARGLRLQTRLNDQIMQNANTEDLIFDVVSLISIISEAITLEVGDVIVTGTPAGVGAARTPKLFMAPGDICEVEIEGVGLLRNRIAQEQTAKAAPARAFA
ncbi:fumarylacetoacetate hydrolase family protein [Methylocapsa sp. S129]|uniref:fumarylacetoacetate hydrolase family protein n=1 Tax=Methylocapsa sp. S129 TaxID=1641869 RepID=UPI00131DA8BB|nr:fumarylacetoacetate hydrolase family protein [Methylocapsa sp. S129]